MNKFTLKDIEKTIGTPLASLFIMAAIFMAPKFIYDNYKYYKGVACQVGEALK